MPAWSPATHSPSLQPHKHRTESWLHGAREISSMLLPCIDCTRGLSRFVRLRQRRIFPSHQQNPRPVPVLAIASAQSSPGFLLQKFQCVFKGRRRHHLVPPVPAAKSAPYLQKLPCSEEILLDPEGVVPVCGCPSPRIRNALIATGDALVVHS